MAETRLPANLPENWEPGQIVAPEGTEVGLSERHGYNYLMKQVNNAQQVLNNLEAEVDQALGRVSYALVNIPEAESETWESDDEEELYFFEEHREDMPDGDRIIHWEVADKDFGSIKEAMYCGFFLDYDYKTQMLKVIAFNKKPEFDVELNLFWQGV